jgi:putative membrane protein
MARFPRSVYGEGREPDPRFSLANERTFLAWIRTALALVAAGVAIEVLEVGHPVWRLVAALVLIVLGVIAVVRAWFSWAGTERALRREEPLPGLRIGIVIAGGVAIAVVLLTVGLLL